MKIEVNASAFEDCTGWILQCLADYTPEKSATMAMVLWGIWSARNLKVWEKEHLRA